MKILVFFLLISEPAFSVTDYRYSVGSQGLQTFPSSNRLERLQLEAGIDAKLEVGVNCGQVDVMAAFSQNLDKLREIPKEFGRIFENDTSREIFIQAAGTLAIARMFPSAYAYVTEQTARLDELLSYQFDMCKYVDNYLQGQADIGKQELRAQAQAKCIQNMTTRLDEPVSMTVAIDKCKHVTGLTVVDFANGVNRVASGTKQDMLHTMISFATSDYGKSKNRYETFAGLLGEVEYKDNGQWVAVAPEVRHALFPANIPYVAEAVGFRENRCHLSKIYEISQVPKDPIEAAVWTVVHTKVPREYVDAINDIYEEKYQTFICHRMARSIGVEATKVFKLDLANTMSVALGQPHVPNDVKKHFRTRLADIDKGLEAAIAHTPADRLEIEVESLKLFLNLVERKSDKIAGQLNYAKEHNARVLRELREGI